MDFATHTAMAMEAILNRKPKRHTETTEAEDLSDVLVEYEYILINPDWFREGDEPVVQVVDITLSYNAHNCLPSKVGTRFLPGPTLQKIEEEIAQRLVREAA